MEDAILIQRSAHTPLQKKNPIYTDADVDALTPSVKATSVKFTSKSQSVLQVWNQGTYYILTELSSLVRRLTSQDNDVWKTKWPKLSASPHKEDPLALGLCDHMPISVTQSGYRVSLIPRRLNEY